jgi:LAS superfamily LD-carboxypeptidase LdcB
MSGIATAVVATGVLTYLGTQEAAKSSKEGAATMAAGATSAAEVQAQSQREQLEYLKEVNALPTELRNEALTQLGGMSGIGDKNTQQEILDRAKASPFYKEMIAEGEEGVLRGASATGGLRSGNVQSALFNERRQALQSAYGSEVSNLRGLAGLSTGQNQIAQTMGNIGATQAGGIYGAAQATSQGQIAQGQIAQQGLQGIANIGMQGVGMGIYGGYI